MSNWTEGPWIVDGTAGFLHVVHPLDGRAVANVPHLHPNAQANAQLISAAPDLYEALEQAITSMQDSGYANESVVVLAGKQALAKARGES